jgi:hypothetical protein
MTFRDTLITEHAVRELRVVGKIMKSRLTKRQFAGHSAKLYTAGLGDVGSGGVLAELGRRFMIG